MNPQRVIVSLLLLATAACSTAQAPTVQTPTVQTPTAQLPNSTVPGSLTASPAQSASQPKNIVRTEPFSPNPIQIALNDLPQPFATESASKSPNVVSVPANPVLKVPKGFVVNVFAEGLDRPRWLALTPDGNVLVTETRQNRIRLLSDRNDDGVAEVNQQFAGAENGLNIPFGMTFANGYFFLGNTDAVLRFPYASGQQRLTGTGEKIADLPGGGYNQHWTRNVVAAPNQQKLYVSVGSQSNADEEPLPRASVQVMNLDGSGQQTFASGLRNPVGLDFNPATGELFATVNERDGLGDDLVPDYLTQVQQGGFYGWPYAYLSPDRLDPRQTVDGRSRRPDLAARTRTPDVLFQAHSAALGLQFYDGKTFPEQYRKGAFVAFRGSWNRNQGTGYKIGFVPFDANNRPVGTYEDFVTGFLTDPSVPTTWARPVGLLVQPDGSLLFTDEANGRIYRVQYQGG
jgi:glucose/arabinose dehydrogenase